MKKIIYQIFGGIDVMQLVESEMPAVASNSLLIKVKAASINPLDWKIRNGEMKLVSGSKFPKGIGIDFSGTVEKAGSGISKYKKNDAVFGWLDVFKGGALAEYIVVSENDIALKPQNISFEQAAAMTVVGGAAVQMFDQLANITKNTEVLINGATGGIGMFAVQMAKLKGAIVTSVVSANGIDLAKKWNSDVVIDYKKENILAAQKKYDVIIDLSGKIPFSLAKQIMKPASTYVNTVPGPKEIIGSFLNNIFSKKKYKVLMLKPSPLYLQSLAKYAAGGIDIVVAKTYSLQDFKEAYTETQKGGFAGKVVLVL